MPDYQKTTIVVEVLSDGPFEWDDLEDVHNQTRTVNGHASMICWTEKWGPLTLEEMEAECLEHGTDPTFFTEAAADEEEWSTPLSESPVCERD